MEIERLNDSYNNLEFNLKTITRNKGLRGVIFKETRELINHIDIKSREPQWKQLLVLIQDKMLEIELEIENKKNNCDKSK